MYVVAVTRILVPYGASDEESDLTKEQVIYQRFLHSSVALRSAWILINSLSYPFLDLIQTEFHLAALQITQRRCATDAHCVASQLTNSCSHFYGRISKEEAEALVRRRGGSYLLRWSASMAGVYFVVASSMDGLSVRHIQIEKVGDPQGRSVAVKMPVIDDRERRDTRSNCLIIYLWHWRRYWSRTT